MPLLAIKQTTGLTAKVEFDGGDWTVEFQDPFTLAEEEELRWCFETHLEFPMLETNRAEQAAASIQRYGNTLFRQLFFSHPDLYAAFKRQHSDQIRIEISGSPDFHRLHWETLWPPDAPNPLAYRTVIARRADKKNAPKVSLDAGASIRVLVVVARPGRDQDVGYRTISRPPGGNSASGQARRGA